MIGHFLKSKFRVWNLMIIDKTLKEYLHKKNVCNELKKEHSQRPSNDH